MMDTDYIKAFIIGSSFPVFVLYFYQVSKYDEIANYPYKNYTFIAPVFLGLLNAFGLYISKEFNLSRIYRFLLTAIIGALLVSIIITIIKAYKFDTKEQWIEQYIGLFIM